MNRMDFGWIILIYVVDIQMVLASSNILKNRFEEKPRTEIGWRVQRQQSTSDRSDNFANTIFPTVQKVAHKILSSTHGSSWNVNFNKTNKIEFNKSSSSKNASAARIRNELASISAKGPRFIEENRSIVAQDGKPRTGMVLLSTIGLIESVIVGSAMLGISGAFITATLIFIQLTLRALLLFFTGVYFL